MAHGGHVKGIEQDLLLAILAVVCTDVAHCVCGRCIGLLLSFERSSDIVWCGVNPSPIPSLDVAMAQACYQWDGHAGYKFAIFPASCATRL